MDTQSRPGPVSQTDAGLVPVRQRRADAARANEILGEHTLERGDTRYAAVKQYSLVEILAVWAAAAVPMAVLAWVVAPWLADRLDGPVALGRALLALLTVGLIWQFVLVVLLIHRERGSLRWSVLKDALWLQSPRSPTTGRLGGRLWLVLVPALLIFTAEGFFPHPFPPPTGHDFAAF